MSSLETVKVVVRVRPLLQIELNKSCQIVVDSDRAQSQIIIKNPKTSATKIFAYDNIYPQDSSQELIYDETAFPLIEQVIEGYNGTIFAYGQTGCGKTYTMVGNPQKEEQGILPNSFHHIFGCVGESSQNKKFLIRCSYCEIYNEEIRDLLNYDEKNKLELLESKEKGIHVKGLNLQIVKSAEDVANAMEMGNAHRVTKQTQMNERSSRSHAIFTIYIETSQEISGRETIRAGKINFVDLAGSERQKKTGVVGDRLKEAIEINLSLSALGNVINALVDGNVTHIPYRDSKLTRLLQDSLGGNTKTVMIAVVSPADYNYEESLSTLRYASRAKFIKNKPIINEDPKDALLRSYAEEIERLKRLLYEKNPNATGSFIEYTRESKTRAESEFDDTESRSSLDQSKILKRERDSSLRTVRSKSRNSDPKKKHSSVTPMLMSNASSFSEEQEVNTERENLEMMVKKLEEQLVVGGEALFNAEQERLNAKREFLKKLKKQREKEKKLAEKNKQHEEELMKKEKNYASLQEEVDALRESNKLLQTKYDAALSEIDDINKEKTREQEEVFNAYRASEREIEFLNQVIMNFVDLNELMKIKMKSQYDEDNHTWKVPAFVVQKKQTLFPKLPRAQLREVVQRELKQRHLVFKGRGSPSPDVWNPISEESDEDKDLSPGPHIVKCQLDYLGNHFSNSPQEHDARPTTSGTKSRNQKYRNRVQRPMEPIESGMGSEKSDWNNQCIKKKMLSPIQRKPSRPYQEEHAAFSRSGLKIL
ncbi:unnamed protein product [Blepharisma stoltei]|uniref:Kinesin-like protein n=1 Tax=Blepharisma stoltei TaxID=1481888 RepID=A0AAU9K109_9CILI|nr:unnamed protein product [Blepharisma stoltei]